jgi:hypothetical protein
MIIIDNTLISDDILNKKFKCNTNVCKGACCVKGEEGAPLEKNEEALLNKNFKKLEKYISKDGFEIISNQGVSTKDNEGVLHTPLVNERECAYVNIDEKGIVNCGIENAYNDKVIDFQKPISCHLYPVRISELKNYTALNFHNWEVCESACSEGDKNNIHLIDFLKDAFKRKFGEKWFGELLKNKK